MWSSYGDNILDYTASPVNFTSFFVKISELLFTLALIEGDFIKRFH